MKKIGLLISSLGVSLAAVLCAAPADAANLRSWVSSSGSGTACTHTAPCANFAAALAATASGGEINCLTPGEYGNGATLTITQSVTINCYGVLAGITAPSGSPAISVNGSGITVSLLNLEIDGNGEGTEGIAIINATAMSLVNVIVQNFTDRGVLNESTGVIHLGLNNCTIGPNAGTNLGISAASGSGTFVYNSVLNDGKWGVAVTSGNSVAVQNSIIGVNSAGGIYGADGSGVYVLGTQITVNPIGVENAGTAGITINNSDIVGNSTGVSGTWYSYGNNRVFGNALNGTSPTPVTTE